MQERFNVTGAIKAANVFTYFLDNKEDREKILAKSNKNLIILTALVYFKECSNVKLKKLFPIQNVSDTMQVLENAGLISTRVEGARAKVYTVTEEVSKYSASIENHDRTLMYVFANCLMNMDTYIKQYGIKSWNLLALMLEASLKAVYNDQYIHLGRNTILSVQGNDSNRMVCRKTLETMGIIRPKVAGGKKSNGSLFTLNKKAFIIERK